MIETTSCPVCNSTSWSYYLNSCDFLLTHEDFNLVKCQTCGVIFTNPRICESTIGDYYTPEYTSYNEQRNNKVISFIKNLVKFIYIDNHQKIIKLLKEHNVRTVLEVGPGNGSLLRSLYDNGFKVTGIEIDSSCVNRIKEMGLDCEQGKLGSLKKYLTKYDAVIMCQVLEHLYHPTASLEIIHSILTNNGLLYISVPNISSFEARLFRKYWRGLDLPRHITHFNRETICSLLSNSGYSIEKISNMSFPSSFIESLAFLSTKKGRFIKFVYFPLYYIWKIFSPLHVAILGSGILEVVVRRR